MSGFNFVDQLLRFSFGGDQVEPAPRHHLAGRESENPVGYGVAMVIIVQKPRIDVALAERKTVWRQDSLARFYSKLRNWICANVAAGAHPGVFAKIRFRTLGGNVSHAVRSTNLGACSRMLIR